MAGEEPTVTPPGASAPEPVVVDSSPPAAAPVVAPEPAVVAAPEPAPAPAEPAKPAVEPTLLQKHDAEVAAAAAKPEPAKPVEAKPAVDPAKPAAPAAADPAKPAEPVVEAAPVAEPVALEPVEYKYELPETITLDDPTRASFHTALDAFRHDPIAGAQGLIDLHNKTMTDYAVHVANEQQRVWNDTRKEWRTKVMADEQLGGAGYQTTIGAVARMRDLLVSDQHRAEFDDYLITTGSGDHPALLRLLHNAARLYDEAPMAPPNPRPAPNGGKPPSGRLRDMYKTSQPRG